MTVPISGNASTLAYSASIYCSSMVDLYVENITTTPNFRLTTIHVANDSTGNFNYNETTTQDAGSTSNLTFTVSYSNPNIIITAVNASGVDQYQIRVFPRLIKF